MAQLKDLLVLGASRFLNIIHGSIDGNAATADKLNKKLVLKVNGVQQGEYDGTGVDATDEVVINLTPSTFGLQASTRLVGETLGSVFGVDETDDRWCVIEASSTAIVPIKTWYNVDLRYGTGTVTIDSTAYGYYLPQVGDIIKCGTLELICIGVNESGVTVSGTSKPRNSHWTILGNNEVWNTY